ncbi:MAG: hypothetical protein K2I06_07055 [Ruminococcus sp.]|nr:hypothetical protein [Ruminococcus sp.]
MTGTGTQTDPYIVSTWDDLVTSLSTTNSQSNMMIYIELNADIDMNEVAPSGISAIETKSNFNLDGKGHIIKNLVANDGFLRIGSAVGYSETYISNLKILNFESRGSNNSEYFIFVSSGIKVYFQHCTLSGINVSTRVLLYVNKTSNSQAHFSATDEGGSMLDINVYTGGFLFGNIYLEDSYAKISGEEICDEDAVWHMNNSYIEGRISGRFQNCYNSVVDAVSNNGDKNFGVSSCSNLLVNTDKFNGTFTTSVTGIKKVTAEQLIDAEYLESIGFPLGVD